ncbi:MAG: ribose-phosphate pyrophosphokinase-like domain-containing protein, partial [Eubacteriales bacterium]|nr:ribose-phosphate pyrophosphokinase-like domain-containing protein [Eubacteriales bacterium]
MTDIKYLEQEALPVAPLKIAALESCSELGKKVNDHIVNFRRDALRDDMNSPLFSSYKSDNYLIKCECPRFGSGESKGHIRESIRGTDLFLMVDVCNYSLTYTVNGHLNHMSPDDHYQDLKRIISA